MAHPIHFTMSDPLDHETLLREEIRTFLDQEMSTNPDLFGSGGHNRSFSQRLGQAGFVGMMIPHEFGGRGRTAVDQLIVVEELLAVGAPIGAHYAAERQSAPMILRFGSEAQQLEFLPRIAAGEIGFSIGMSEPDAGSDLAAVRTQARKTDEGWRISGTKVWTSWAHLNQYMIALCRTTPPNTGDRHRGLTQFLIDLNEPAVEVHPIETLTGRREFCEVVFDELLVPEAAVLGVVGNGWSQVTSELAYERSGPDRWMSTMPLFEYMVGSGLFGDSPEVLGRSKAWYRILHELSFGIARGITLGDEPAIEGAIVKELGTRFEQEVLATARSAMPGEPDPNSSDSFVRELANSVLSAPAYTIRGGTTEILHSVVANAVLR